MESVKNLEDVKNLMNNKFIGTPDLINSEIKFNGINNILVCEGTIKLTNTNIIFQGNNSIIYLSYTKHNYNYLSIFVRNNSTIFIGKNNEIGSRFDINLQEHQNLIIGDDCIFGNDVRVRTCDAHAVFDLNTKERINFSKSIFIGDHVWIDHFSYLSRGAHVGSGAIVGFRSLIPPSFHVHSNTYVMGNPCKIYKENVFFTNDFTGIYNSEDTLNFSSYKSDIFHYKFVQNETLSLDNIDRILMTLTVNERLDFLEKLFIKNKRKNRFYS